MLNEHEIDYAESLGLLIYEAGHHSKKPVQGVKFGYDKNALKSRLALTAVARSDNLIGKAGKDHTWFDYDKTELNPVIQPLTMRTPTQKTPHGYAILTNGALTGSLAKTLWDRLRKEAEIQWGEHVMDTARTLNQYEVIPLSETCALPGKNGVCDLEQHPRYTHNGNSRVDHDWRIREWIHHRTYQLDTLEFMRLLLKGLNVKMKGYVPQ